jgi:hypothetical protein
LPEALAVKTIEFVLKLVLGVDEVQMGKGVAVVTVIVLFDFNPAA